MNEMGREANRGLEETGRQQWTTITAAELRLDPRAYLSLSVRGHSIDVKESLLEF